jgi:GntR family transcriptional regulator
VLRSELVAWLDKARRAGLPEDSIEALFLTTFRKATEVTP